MAAVFVEAAARRASASASARCAAGDSTFLGGDSGVGADEGVADSEGISFISMILLNLQGQYALPSLTRCRIRQRTDAVRL
jgi:hypothetical protein